MHKKVEINWTKIKGGCQLGRKVVTHNSKSDLPLVINKLAILHIKKKVNPFPLSKKLFKKNNKK